jgi:ATP-dependent DNA helicase RecG
MTNHSIETIEKLLNAKEGENHEFKEAKTSFQFDKAVQYCCALANSGGGKLVLGITDKRPRKVVGSNAFSKPERTRRGLIDKLRVKVDFEMLEHDGKRVLVFEVASRPVGMPVQADGVVWWREADNLVPMPQEMVRDVYAEASHDFSNGICVGAMLNDLDESAIKKFRKMWAGKSKNARIKTLSVLQLLTDCGAVIEDKITYAALILFGKRAALEKHLPHCEIVFEYRSTNAAGPAQQREDFRIGFFACLDRIWQLINLRNDLQHYQDRFAVLDVPTFNEFVVREAILNAVSHRNYQMMGSIFVRQYRDRLVIESPGGLPSGITVDNILHRQAARNRKIADILLLCGLTEHVGQGMNLMYELSIKEAKPIPDFSGSDAHYIMLTLNGVMLNKQIPVLLRHIEEEKLALFITDDYLIIDAIFNEKPIPERLNSRVECLNEIGIIEQAKKAVESIKGRKIGTNQEIKGGIKGGIRLNDTEAAVLDLLQINNTYTMLDIIKITGKGKTTIERAFGALSKNGIIRHIGARKSGYWEIL